MVYYITNSINILVYMWHMSYQLKLHKFSLPIRYIWDGDRPAWVQPTLHYNNHYHNSIIIISLVVAHCFFVNTLALITQ